MIGHKVLPAFYTIELEGTSASLEFILGTRHRIKKISIASRDFPSDLHAAVAGKQLYEFFISHLEGEELIEYNPEFFLTQTPLEPTLQQEQREREAEATEEKLQQEGVQSVSLTRRFDEWGDFVVSRAICQGSDFKVLMKSAVNPSRYILEKGLEKQEHNARLNGLRSEPTNAVVH